VRFLLAAGIALCSCVAAAGASSGSKDDALRHWLDGPVHYIITPAEIKEFKALKTDADRVAFVERFWRRRDPTPDTMSNEYRQLFWNRVKEANDKFVDTSKPGWMTDRGKIYILYGPPDEVKEDPNAKVQSKNSDGVGLIRWVYLKPGGRPDIDPVVYVPFVRDTSGEYHVSYDPGLASPFFNFASIDDRRTAGLPSFVTATTSSRSPIGVLLDLGKMQEVPPQEKYLIDTVETVETFAYQPLPLVIDRFRPDESGTLAVVTVSIPGPADGVPPSLIARFARVGGGISPHLLGEGSFRVEGEGVARAGQGRVRLEAGSWDVTVLAVDPATGVSRIYKGRLDPLPSGPELAVSDTVVSREMEPLAFVAQSSYDAPYIVGGFRRSSPAASRCGSSSRSTAGRRRTTWPISSKARRTTDASGPWESRKSGTRRRSDRGSNCRQRPTGRSAPTGSGSASATPRRIPSRRRRRSPWPKKRPRPTPQPRSRSSISRDRRQARSRGDRRRVHADRRAGRGRRRLRHRRARVVFFRAV
jgi:GWxTD domain-containing protein